MTEVEREGEACALRAVPMWVFSGHTGGKPQLGASSAAAAGATQSKPHRGKVPWYSMWRMGTLPPAHHSLHDHVSFPKILYTWGNCPPLQHQNPFPRQLGRTLGKKLAGFNWPKLGRRPRRSALRCIMVDSFDTPSQMPQTQTSAPVTYFACS